MYPLKSQPLGLQNEAFLGMGAVVPLQMWLVKVRSKQSPVVPSWT